MPSPSPSLTISTPARGSGAGTFVIGASLLLVAGAFLAATIARSQAQEFTQLDDPSAKWTVLGATMLTVVAWLVGAWFMPRIVTSIGVGGLTLIGMLSALHFLFAAAARIVGIVLAGVFGPFAIFYQGLGDEGLPCFVSAVLVVLRPRPGTLGFSLATVFLLMVVTSGTLGLTSLVFITTSIVAHEGALALLGLTIGSSLRQPASHASLSIIVRMALAIGAANALTLFVQCEAYRVWYRLQLADWYVWALVVVTGFMYGAVGAALGTIYGFRWRRIAP